MGQASHLQNLYVFLKNYVTSTVKTIFLCVSNMGLLSLANKQLTLYRKSSNQLIVIAKGDVKRNINHYCE